MRTALKETMRLNLLTNQELEKIVDTDEVNNIPDSIIRVMKVMAVEILEYRRAYGPLGCEWLEC
jgi:hypothetical protein